MSTHEYAHQPSDFERFLVVLLDQGTTLAILIDEYTRATGIAYGMLKNKIYYILNTMRSLHVSLCQYLPHVFTGQLDNRFHALFTLLDMPEALKLGYSAYVDEMQRAGEHLS